MTAPGQLTNAQQESSSAVLDTAKDQSGALAGAATSAASEVTTTAKEQAGNIVGETVEQAKNLTADLQQSARKQFDQQSENVALHLRTLSQQLRDGDTSGIAGQLMTEAGQRLQSLSQYVDRVGPQGLVEDVRRYARRNPGTFFLTAALAGFASGRLAKAAKAGAPTVGSQPVGSQPVMSQPVTPPAGARHAVQGAPAPTSSTPPFDLTGTPVVPARGAEQGLL